MRPDVHCFTGGSLVLIALLLVPTCSTHAATCSVVKHNPPTQADKAFLAADYAKAESLYQADLAKDSDDPELVAGLVHAMLHQQKVNDAADAVGSAIEVAPNSAALLTLNGEIQLRQGQPWDVEQTVLKSYKIDPCNPRTRLLFARFLQINSRYATARQQITLAHQFDPEDAEIRLAWILTLPADQRIPELESYLSAPAGDDQATIHQLHTELDRWKKQAAEPARACRLVSPMAPADIPFVNLIAREHPRAFGLQVALNGSATRLQIGSVQGGLVVYRSAADRAGLKRLSQPETVIPGAKPTYAAYADSIKIGSFEFQNCPVTVIDSGSPDDDGDGMIGLDVFSDFLVTLDYPMHKVQLAQLPGRPAESAPPLPSLKTITAVADDPTANQYDRIIAPDMKDYSQIYRMGSNLIVPAVLNNAKVKLFTLDFSLDLPAGHTTISPGVAMDVTKVHEEDKGWGKMIVADEITYNFAHMSQKVNGVLATSTSVLSASLGMDIAGSIGANTFQFLIMHIDYRDGLLKCEYIPNRGYKF